jgi:dCMP deaminase
MIIQAGIRKVVFLSDQYHDTDPCRASRIMFQMAGVTLKQHVPRLRQVSVLFQQGQAKGESNEKKE